MTTRFTFENKDTRVRESHEVEWYRDFIEEHVHRAGLQIGRHLHQIGKNPVFVVAATGVGKTVAVPVHLFVQLCDHLQPRAGSLDPAPFVLVVEPTIPICRTEAEHMNRSFHAFLASRGLPTLAHPFGVVTGTYKANVQAPIRFVTTGVFERMAERIDPARCRVVIDEAHRTLAQSAGVEIAACAARDRGVVVSWMSATVDSTDLADRFGVDLVLATEERYPILKVPTHAPLEECVGDVVSRCLIRPAEIMPSVEAFRGEVDRNRCERARLHLLSQTTFKDPFDGAAYPGLSERAQGMLVIVNSHQGENSDTRRIADRIRAACVSAEEDIEVLRLASAVVRDPDQQASFRRRVAGVEARQGRYVIVATNVVEMGITFPSLDYVVTMDTELETSRVGGVDTVQERPLGVNAFYQRIGRVGRRRPGVALLTRESARGSDFSTWSLDDLAGRLRLEPICFAISRGDVRELAFSLYERQVAPDAATMRDYLARQRMPSRPDRDQNVLRAVAAERASIKAARLSDDGRRLNARGRRFRRIGVVSDLELGSLLAQCIDAGGELKYIALITAASPGGMRELLGRRTWLEEDEPTLSHVVPFARDQFNKPLEDVVRALRSFASPIDARMLGTESAIAHYLSELIAEGYGVDDPRQVKRDNRLEDPALLTLSRATIHLDRSSELLAVYDIVRWFMIRYRSDLTDANLADYERERVRVTLKEEARFLGVDANRIGGVMYRVEEIARHAGIDLGAMEFESRIPEDLLNRLVLAGGGVRTEMETGTIRRELVRIYQEKLSPRLTGALPEISAIDRRRFVRMIEELDLFVPVELRPGEDARGLPILQGNVSRAGVSTSIIIERGRTSLRFAMPTRVRGRVVPLTYTDSEGREIVRHTLTLASALE